MRRMLGPALILCALGGCSNDLSPINGIVLHPGIGINASLTTVGIVRGGSMQIALTVSRVQGFTGPVDLSLGTLPAGVTASVSPATVPADAVAATLSLSISGTAPLGNATVIVRGKGGNVADAELDFTVSINP